MTIAELMEALQGCDPDAEVRLAHQPSWPLEYALREVAEVLVDHDGPAVVYLVEGAQLGYLPEEAADTIGW